MSRHTAVPLRAPLAAAVALALGGWLAPATSQAEIAHARLADVDLDSQLLTQRGNSPQPAKRAFGRKPLSSKGQASNILYSEDFSNCGGDPPVPAPPPAPYSPPLGLTVHNVDGRTPSTQVNWVSSAWIVREDFIFNNTDCAIFSTSWYTPMGAADDWVVLPQVTPTASTELSWNALAPDGAYRDGYEVRVSTASDSVVDFLANPPLLSIAAEETVWTARTLSLAAYAGTPIRIAFRNNSNDKFLLLLDDLLIEDPVQFDPVLQSLAQPRFEYAEVPAFLGYQYDLSASVANAGSEPLTDVTVTADTLLDGVPVDMLAAAPVPSLNPGASVDVQLGAVTFDQAGAWGVEAMVSAVEGDDLPGNSADAAELVLATPQRLGRFEGPISGALGIGSGEELGELGTDFTVPGAARLAEARVVMLNNDVSDPPDGIPDYEGRTFRMLLREFDSNAATPGAELASSTTVFPTGPALGDPVELTFDFANELLNPGRYVLTIEEPVDPTPLLLSVATHAARFTPGTQWVIWPSSPLGGWANPEDFGPTFAVSLSITAVLDPAVTVPVAADDAFEVAEDGLLEADARTNDTLSDDGGNVWSLVQGASNGLVDFTNGLFTYTPAPDYNGPDSFTYELCDVDDDCDTATVSITVTPVNDLPVAADDAFEVNEDSDLSGDVRTNDDASGDGGNAWSLVQGAGNGLVEFTDGLFTYTPDPDYNGPDSFTYQLCDVDGDCDTATVSITVNPVNDLPEAVADAFEVGPAGSVSGDVSLNDTASPEGGNAWTLVTPPDNGTLDLAGDGSFTYTAAPGFEGSTSFVYALCDVDEDCSQATVSIEVLPTTVFSDAFESLPELRRTAP